MTTYEFVGSLPADFSFEHNLLFRLVEEGGLRDLVECEHTPERQAFKVMITIERTDDKVDEPDQRASMPWKPCKRLW